MTVFVLVFLDFYMQPRHKQHEVRYVAPHIMLEWQDAQQLIAYLFVYSAGFLEIFCHCD